MKKLVFLLLPLLLSISCKTTKKVQQDKQTKPVVPSLKKENIHTLAAKIKNNEFNFKWISAHVSVEMDDDSSHTSFSGNLRICKDSVIWMSVSVIGIKMLQVLLTQDSAMFINYHTDSYFKGDYDYVDKLIHNDVDYDMAQSILTGTCMEFYSDTSKMKSYFDGSQYIISTIRKRKLKKVLYKNREYKSKDDGQFIFLDPQDFRISHIQIKDFVNNRSFDAFYSDFQKVDSVMFPCHIQYQIKAEKNIKVDLQYKKVMFKSQEEAPFVIPKKYAPLQH